MVIRRHFFGVERIVSYLRIKVALDRDVVDPAWESLYDLKVVAIVVTVGGEDRAITIEQPTDRIEVSSSVYPDGGRLGLAGQVQLEHIYVVDWIDASLF